MIKAELRSYVKIAYLIKEYLIKNPIPINHKLPTERDLAERFNVSRTLVREALIMLEIEGLVSIKKGSGVYLLKSPDEILITEKTLYEEVGPFELLQARQLVESGIAEFAAVQANPNDIIKLKDILSRERIALDLNKDDYNEDEEFHLAIAEITQNEVLIQIQKELWKYRSNSMWKGLHAHITDKQYRKLWLKDHEKILNSIQHKNPILAKKMMWQHLENVKKKLFELSDVEHPDFDGFLYNINPVVVGM